MLRDSLADNVHDETQVQKSSVPFNDPRGFPQVSETQRVRRRRLNHVFFDRDASALPKVKQRKKKKRAAQST